jgi:hypothetical protein
MKKSLNYGAAAILAFLLAFAACEQATDSDDSGSAGRDEESFQSELDGIAVAFADGADTVYLKNDLRIGNGELVIPPGKHLDLKGDYGIPTGGLTITGFTAQSKLIILGDIWFSSNNSKDIDMTGSGAYIIASRPYIEGNVNITDTPDYKQEKSKHILATSDQIIYIASINLADADSWQAYIDDPELATDNYIAVTYDGTIDGAIADNINKYGFGRRLYLIGNVTLGQNAVIDLTKGPFVGPTGNSVRNAAFADADSSLVIAGNAIFTEDAKVTTKGGFTALGNIRTAGDRANTPLIEGGALAAYYMNINGGATFEGPVNLISSVLSSNFGNAALFGGTVTVNGPAVVWGIGFSEGSSGGYVVFNKTVEFAGPDDAVNKDGQFIIKGPIVITNTTAPLVPVKGFDFSQGGNPSVAFDQPFTAGTFLVFDPPVTFNKSFTTKYGVVFNADVTFKDIFTLPEGVGSVAAFKGQATFAKLADFRGTQGIFKGNTEFKDTLRVSRASADALDFSAVPAKSQIVFNVIEPFYNVVAMPADVTFKSSVTIGEVAGSFSGNATFEGTAKFLNAIALNDDENGVGLKTIFNNSVAFIDSGSISTGSVIFNGHTTVAANTAAGAGGSASLFLIGADSAITYKENGVVITIENSGGGGSIQGTQGASIDISNGAINISKGTLSLGSLGVTVSAPGAGGILLDGSGYTTPTLVLVGTTSVGFDNYVIDGSKNAATGEAIIVGSLGALTLGGKKISSADNMGALAGNGIFNIAFKDNTLIQNAQLDITKGGTLTIDGYSDTNFNPFAITLSGGTTALNNTGGAGIINATNVVAGGTITLNTSSADWGFILANGPLDAVTRPMFGFVTTAGTTATTVPAGTFGLTGANDIITVNNSASFVPFYLGSGTGTPPATVSVDEAWSLVTNAKSGPAAGSIAVFATTPPVTN